MVVLLYGTVQYSGTVCSRTSRTYIWKFCPFAIIEVQKLNTVSIGTSVLGSETLEKYCTVSTAYLYQAQHSTVALCSECTYHTLASRSPQAGDSSTVGGMHPIIRRRIRRATLFTIPVVATGVWAWSVLKSRRKLPPDIRFPVGSPGIVCASRWVSEELPREALVPLPPNLVQRTLGRISIFLNLFLLVAMCQS